MGNCFFRSCSKFSFCVRQNLERNSEDDDDRQEIFNSEQTNNMGATHSISAALEHARTGQRQQEQDLTAVSDQEIAEVLLRFAERQRPTVPLAIERIRSPRPGPSSSAYVNELYMSSNMSGRDEVHMHIQQEEKRKARIKGLLEQLKTDKFTKDHEDDECPICMVEFEIGEEIRKLPCNHVYHLKCIDDWLLRSFTCPSCMEPVDSALLSAFTPKQGIDLNQLACSPASSGSSIRAVVKNLNEHHESDDDNQVSVGNK